MFAGKKHFLPSCGALKVRTAAALSQNGNHFCRSFFQVAYKPNEGRNSVRQTSPGNDFDKNIGYVQDILFSYCLRTASPGNS